ncbi:MAG: glycoside hydrolase family 5 protein [Bacteroidales bacterium]|nr:glycoside hydrolase family 5 protein [Bacteroidales bacterium]
MLALVSAACRQQNPKVERLHVEGTALMNESGDTVELCGMSFGWNCLWPRFYNAAAVKYVVEQWHADVVRAAVGVELRAPEAQAECYLDNPSFGKESACTIVDAAVANGVYVIVDWHAHGLHTEAAVEFFTYMAGKYKGVPNVIYEIWNEPSYKDHEKQIDYTWAEIKEYSETVIAAIRAIEKEAVIIVGTPRWSQNVDDAADDPITGYENLMYTLHFYAGTHKQWLRDKADYALSKGIPLFVTECGGMNADGQGPIDEASTQEWLEWMDDNDISCLFWSISDKEETCSMLLPEAPSTGPWGNAVIKPWGGLVKNTLKERYYGDLKQNDQEEASEYDASDAVRTALKIRRWINLFM